MQPGGEPPFWRKQAKLIVVLNAGHCEITQRTPGTEVKTFDVTGEQFCLIGAGVKFDFLCQKASALAVIGIDPVTLAGYPITTSDTVTPLKLDALGRADVLIWSIVAHFRRLCRWETQALPALLEALATAFAIQVLQAIQAPAKAPKPGLSPAQMRQVNEFITRNLAQPITVAELAREAHLSAYHFMRLFKQNTGVSPHRYLIARRVEEAHALLRDGNHRVADAAYAVGFCDQSHLDRHFRRHYGYAPRTLLRQLDTQI